MARPYEDNISPPTDDSASLVRGFSWPHADRLFRGDPRWRGSDDAYSIPLDESRTLWLFGDTFIALDGGPRAGADTVANTIGIQTGRDPSAASMRFFWPESGGRPESVFSAGAPQSWLWPLHGAFIGGHLLIFLMVVRDRSRRGRALIDAWRADGPLGFFEVYDWTAVRVANPADEPAAWLIEPARLPPDRTGPIPGSSVIMDGDFVTAYACDAKHRMLLCRWPGEDAAAGDLRRPEWWSRSGWRRDRTPGVVFDRGATELSVHRRGGGWLQTQMSGLRRPRLVMRTAPSPQGPWSRQTVVFRPDEASTDGVFAYAGKAHPHLEGAPLAATYATIGVVDHTLADESIYYPRFVRLEPEEQ